MLAACFELALSCLRRWRCARRLPSWTGSTCWLLLLVGMGGCLFGSRRDGPVSQDLVRCRQLSLRGVRAREQGQVAQSEEILSQAVQAYPVDPEARRHYAETLWAAEKRELALSQLAEALRLSQDDPSLHLLKCRYELARGQPEAAMVAVQRVIDLDPTLVDAWVLRARVHKAQGETAKALADYHRALGKSPQNREVLTELAEFHWALAANSSDAERHLQRALAALHTLLDSYPQGDEPQNALVLAGRVQLLLGRFDAAQSLLAAACERKPASADALYHLATVELRLGRTVDALRHVREGLQVAPNHAPSQVLLEEVRTLLAGIHGRGDRY